MLGLVRGPAGGGGVMERNVTTVVMAVMRVVFVEVPSSSPSSLLSSGGNADTNGRFGQENILPLLTLSSECDGPGCGEGDEGGDDNGHGGDDEVDSGHSLRKSPFTFAISLRRSRSRA